MPLYHETRGRLRYHVPESIHSHIDTLHAEHRPKTSRCNFIQYLIRLGLESHEAGFKDTGSYLENESSAERAVDCWLLPELPEKFKALYAQEFPKPFKKTFLTFIIAVGMTDYKKRMTIEGYDPEYVAAREF